MFPLIRTLPQKFCSFTRTIKSPSRHFSLIENLREARLSSLQLIDKRNFQLIYEFPGITRVAAFTKTKYVIPACCAVIIGFSFAMQQKNTVVIASLLICTAQLLIVLFAARFLRHTIGKVYINKGPEIKEVLVSSVDKSGRRVDKVYEPKDLIPLSFTSKGSQWFGFAKLSAPENVMYKLNVVSCQIHDAKAFKKLFGDIAVTSSKEEIK